MKNLYCSFLNSSEASVSGDRLIYQESKNSSGVGVESSEGAKKEGSGLFDLATRGQKEIQKKIDHLDFVNLKARIDFYCSMDNQLRKEAQEYIVNKRESMRMRGDSNWKNPLPDRDISAHQEMVNKDWRTIAKELNDRYKIGIDLDKPGISIKTTDDGNIVVMVGAPRGTTDKITIRPDGTFVKTKMKTEVKERAEYFSFDGGGGKINVLPGGKKAPDDF